jgi:hypothetical protein
MKQSTKNILTVLFGLLALFGVFFIIFWAQGKLRTKGTLSIVPTAIDQTDVFKNSNSGIGTEISNKEAPKKQSLPSSFLLSVPFQPQAPMGDWSEPYENACEEASIIMVKYYFDQKELSKDTMKREIDNAVAWEIENWGGHRDLDAHATATLAKEYFGLSGKVVREYSTQYLEEIIHSGKPIIAPSAGRKLGNPNFRGIGPQYHMLVVIGYNNDKSLFITNDPGTRNGKSYVYNQKILSDAISGPEENMAKEILVLEK